MLLHAYMIIVHLLYAYMSCMFLCIIFRWANLYAVLTPLTNVHASTMTAPEAETCLEKC